MAHREDQLEHSFRIVVACLFLGAVLVFIAWVLHYLGVQ
jgi:hypothetical protein